MSQTKYTEGDLLKKDFVTFNKILAECEARARQELKKAAENG